MAEITVQKKQDDYSHLSLDRLITMVTDVRDLANKTKKLVKKYEEEQKVIEGQIISKMEDQGIKLASNGKHKVALDAPIQPKITDWEAATEYILNNKATYLMYKRISTTAFRELLEQGEKIPGIEATDYPKLNIRKS